MEVDVAAHASEALNLLHSSTTMSLRIRMHTGAVDNCSPMVMETKSFRADASMDTQLTFVGTTADGTPEWHFPATVNVSVDKLSGGNQQVAIAITVTPGCFVSNLSNASITVQAGRSLLQQPTLEVLPGVTQPLAQVWEKTGGALRRANLAEAKLQVASASADSSTPSKWSHGIDLLSPTSSRQRLYVENSDASVSMLTYRVMTRRGRMHLIIFR
jgi:hypothetical protein